MTLFNSYRVLAILVGVLLAFCSLMSVFKYLLTEGSTLQQLGDDLSFMWAIHGWLFMVYVVVAFLLSRRAGWSWAFTGTALIAGLVPLLIFWVERKVTERYRADMGEPVAS